MPRTTLQLEDDAMAVARAHAARHRISLGEAVSALVKQGAERPIVTTERNGFRVLRLDRSSPTVTAAQIDKLLDVNILTALLWPAHEHHAAAHRWFHKRRDAHWATTALTQLAFVRIVSNPAFSRDALSPREAIALLAENLRHAAHEFWVDRLHVPHALDTMDALRGHQQLTDAYLLALARQRRGVLATFDRGLQTLAVDTLSDHLEMVPTRDA